MEGWYEQEAKPGATAAYDQHAAVHPGYLHSNSTSHKSPFSAIAELLEYQMALRTTATSECVIYAAALS